MTSIEATDLAVRILGSFTGPPAHEWEEVLADLDAGRAGTAYARIRSEHKHRWLAVAEFMAVYHSLHTTDASNRPDPCGHCDGTGWVQAPDLVKPDGLRYTQVEPCRCTRGRAAPTPTKPAIGLDEYLVRLKRRADDGDTAAADEYATWERWLNRPETAGYRKDEPDV